MNKREVSEQVAELVIFDLENAGYKARLEKNDSRNPKKWRIVPDEELSKEDLIDFNEIKDTKQEIYIERFVQQIKQMRKALMGKV
jgi:hypothetical protein